MEPNQLQPVHLMYESMMKNAQFNEIEHVPNEFIQTQISIQENCLCISHKYFTLHYNNLMKQLSTSKQSKQEQNNWIAEVLLVMNGQNEKAWNLKKALLIKNKLDVGRQLRFNAAVCYKNKKSSIYYEYRIRLYQEFLKKHLSKEQLIQIYQAESKLISKILARFFRNYYCWMYRNRLYKLFKQTIGQELINVQLRLLHKFIQLNPNDYSAYSRLIAIVNQSKISKQQEIKWAEQLKDFCVLAYEKKESYKHIDTYNNFLVSLNNQK